MAIILFFLFSLFLTSQEKVPVKDVVEGEVKVKLSEDLTDAEPDAIKDAPVVKELEIEVVESVKIDSGAKPTESQKVVMEAVPSVAIGEITPTDPDKNLVIYFILLLAIVMGIMVLAAIVPAPRSRDSK